MATNWISITHILWLPQLPHTYLDAKTLIISRHTYVESWQTLDPKIYKLVKSNSETRQSVHISITLVWCCHSKSFELFVSASAFFVFLTVRSRRVTPGTRGFFSRVAGCRKMKPRASDEDSRKKVTHKTWPKQQHVKRLWHPRYQWVIFHGQKNAFSFQLSRKREDNIFLCFAYTWHAVHSSRLST